MGGLSQELLSVSNDVKARVHRPGALCDQELATLVGTVGNDPAARFPDLARASDVTAWEAVTRTDVRLGEKAIAAGEVAFVLLAGGTRPSHVLSELPGLGVSVLAWRLLQASGMPVWIMTNPGSAYAIKRHIDHLSLSPGTTGSVFGQFEGYRLTPDNHLLLGPDGRPELYPLGHGDLGPVLVESGIVDDHPNVKYAYVCNVDNVVASPHPGIIGRHIRMSSIVTCEVVERREDDRGGIVAWVDDRPQVVEDFRLPDELVSEASLLSTNSMLINVASLCADVPSRWHRVKRVVDNRVVVQYERLLQQHTEHERTDFLLVPRDARFCPVKDTGGLRHAGEFLSTYRYA